MDAQDVGHFSYGQQPGKTSSPILRMGLSVYHKTPMYRDMHRLSKNVNDCRARSFERTKDHAKARVGEAEG
jgi:hypothetical protein